MNPKRNPWREEINAPLEGVSSRGCAIWDAYRANGPIGFVGGPWNGRIALVRNWPPSLNILIQEISPLCDYSENVPFEPRQDRYCVYRLTRIHSPYGGQSYCYIAEVPEETPGGWLPEIVQAAIDRVSDRLVQHALRAINGRGIGPLRRAFELSFGNMIGQDLQRRGVKSSLSKAAE